MRITRAARARELLERLERGPSFTPLGFAHDKLSPEEAATERYRLWVRSWVLDELRDLIPELRRKEAP